MVGRITMMTEGSRQEGSRERALVRMSREQTAAPIELPRCTCTPCCALPVGVSDSDALCDAMEVDLRRQASHRVHYVLQTLADFHATATAMHQKRDTAMHKRSGTSVRPEQRKNNAKRETIVTPPSSQNVDWADGLSTDIFGEIVQRAGLSATELVLLYAGRSERMQKETTSGPRTSKPYLVVRYSRVFVPAPPVGRFVNSSALIASLVSGCSACATCQRPWKLRREPCVRGWPTRVDGSANYKTATTARLSS